MRLPSSYDRTKAALIAVRKEQERQMQFIGVRLGVFKRLNELGREERRLTKRLLRLAGDTEQSVPHASVSEVKRTDDPQDP